MSKIMPLLRILGVLCLGLFIGVSVPRLQTQHSRPNSIILRNGWNDTNRHKSPNNHLNTGSQEFWESNIAARSLRQLAKNLAQIGCPNAITVAVIKHEIDRRYNGTVSLLINRVLAAKLANQIIDTSQAIDQLIKRKSIDMLDATGETLNSKIERAILEAQLGDVYLGSDQNLSAIVQQIRDRYMTILKNPDNLTPEDIARHFRNRDIEIMEQLPPAAAKAYLLTETSDSVQTRQATKYLQVDESKFGEVFNATKEFNDKILEWQLADGHSMGTLPDNYDELLREKETAIQKALGETEFANYIRTSDPQFQMLDNWVESKGLPLDVSLALSDVREKVSAAYYSNVTEGSLEPTARAEYLQQLEDYSRREATQILAKYNTELNTGLPIFGWIPGITKGNIPAAPRRK
jgi:hypothetical protein